MKQIKDIKIKNKFITNKRQSYKVKNRLNIIMSKFKLPLKRTDLKEGELVKAEVGDKSIVLGMVKGTIYAMDSVCSHQGGPLEEGWLDDYDLTCPWHQGIFDIRTAKASPKTNWVTDLNSYSVVIDEKSEEIFVEID